MRGKENNEAINLLHARQRQEFLNEERTQKREEQAQRVTRGKTRNKKHQKRGVDTERHNKTQYYTKNTRTRQNREEYKKIIIRTRQACKMNDMKTMRMRNKSEVRDV